MIYACIKVDIKPSTVNRQPSTVNPAMSYHVCVKDWDADSDSDCADNIPAI